MSRESARRGGALILVLVLLSVLSVVAIESMRRAQIEIESAGAYLGGVQCRELCTSGLRLAAALLEHDLRENSHDSLLDIWATFFEDENADKAVEFEIGELEVEIRPENGGFPLEALNSETGRGVMERLLTGQPYGLEQEAAARLVAAMRDWIDADGEGQFEQPAYAAEGLTQRPRNAPMASRDELLLVLGMPRELYFGNGQVPGLRELVTVHGNGRININTAPSLLLAAMCPADVDRATAAGLAMEMVEYRRDTANAERLSAPDWYRTALPGYAQVTLPAELVSVQSDVFRVMVTAQVGAVRRSLRAVLGRKQGQPEPDKPVSRVILERKVLG